MEQPSERPLSNTVSSKCLVSPPSAAEFRLCFQVPVVSSVQCCPASSVPVLPSVQCSSSPICLNPIGALTFRSHSARTRVAAGSSGRVALPCGKSRPFDSNILVDFGQTPGCDYIGQLSCASCTKIPSVGIGAVTDAVQAVSSGYPQTPFPNEKEGLCAKPCFFGGKVHFGFYFHQGPFLFSL